jgi:FtsH-binding integral membrane protein
MLGAEGFAALWWGSARRLRRFLYAGMIGVVLATVAQLINSLQSVNQWIVFGMIGLLVIVVAVLIERKLEEIKAWLEVLETWE